MNERIERTPVTRSRPTEPTMSGSFASAKQLGRATGTIDVTHRDEPCAPRASRLIVLLEHVDPEIEHVVFWQTIASVSLRKRAPHPRRRSARNPKEQLAPFARGSAPRAARRGRPRAAGGDGADDTAGSTRQSVGLHPVSVLRAVARAKLKNPKRKRRARNYRSAVHWRRQCAAHPGAAEAAPTMRVSGYGAAWVEHEPSRGLHDLAGFEDRLGHGAPRSRATVAGRRARQQDPRRASGESARGPARSQSHSRARPAPIRRSAQWSLVQSSCASRRRRPRRSRAPSSSAARSRPSCSEIRTESGSRTYAKQSFLQLTLDEARLGGQAR